MAMIGQNGKVTSFPNTGEKLCVSCEYWMGARELTNNGNAATSMSNRGAMCEMKRASTFPSQPCQCAKYTKWRMIR
ncbi:MAG: hypothetical protein IJ060_08665 [Oscillospiraceae bacterium]|nr:hypothetical protein [Oscillospiraceae bacterium]